MSGPMPGAVEGPVLPATPDVNPVVPQAPQTNMEKMAQAGRALAEKTQATQVTKGPGIALGELAGFTSGPPDLSEDIAAELPAAVEAASDSGPASVEPPAAVEPAVTAAEPVVATEPNRTVDTATKVIESGVARAEREYVEAEAKGADGNKLSRLADNITLEKEKHLASVVSLARESGIPQGRLGKLRQRVFGREKRDEAHVELERQANQARKEYRRLIREDKRTSIGERSSQAKKMSQDAKKVLDQAEYNVLLAHFLLARSENRKKKLRDFLKMLFLVTFVGGIKDTLNQGKDATQRSTQPTQQGR